MWTEIESDGHTVTVRTDTQIADFRPGDAEYGELQTLLARLGELTTQRDRQWRAEWSAMELAGIDPDAHFARLAA